MDKITETLQKLFLTHRVIFWYDTKKELLNEYEALEESNFKKIKIKGNEFEVKYLINKQEPETKFLLYLSGEKPANEENWLLDLELAHQVFHTDQEAMFLQELGLGYHLKELVSDHLEFFKSKERRSKLKELLGEGDEQEDIRNKMLAVVFNTDYVSLRSYIQEHGSAYIYGNEKLDKELERYNLQKYYWGKIKTQYNYQSETPAIYDFLVDVFTSNFVLAKKTKLSSGSKSLLTLWQDSVQYRDSYEKLAERIANDMDLENRLNQTSLEPLLVEGLFRLSDIKIIHELTALVVTGEIGTDKVQQYIKQRENKFWYQEFEHLYQALETGAKLLDSIQKHGSTTYKSFEEGIKLYAAELYTIDQDYRKFIWNYRKTNQNKILANLAKKVEKVYVNDWLMAYNDNWQGVVDKLKQWPTHENWSQQQFFKKYVSPFMAKKQRLFVIVSDALRYECGEELTTRLLAENRFEASIEPMVSSLPSYTQLGMASLLPHTTLAFKDKADTIVVDGMASTGVQGRNKILEVQSGVRATAIKAEDIMKSSTKREFVKQYDLIYIYHNRIDKTGDDKTTEEKVFEAVEDELQFLFDVVKRIGNSFNGNNMIITADHGFLYQYNELDESDFSISEHSGEVWKENRRFVIGEKIAGNSATKSFNAQDLNIASDAEVLIPKSINRLRVKGAGSRFVHGGATLQEVVVPLIKVSKKRKDTTSEVGIDIIKSTDRITTNIHAVSFIQSELVSQQIVPRTVRAGIYAEDGTLLSDLFKYKFDIDEGSERQREVKHKFQLRSEATGKYKNQRVKLILEVPMGDTTKWKMYKEYFYTLNISFTNDFDL